MLVFYLGLLIRLRLVDCLALCLTLGISCFWGGLLRGGLTYVSIPDIWFLGFTFGFWILAFDDSAV